MYHRSVVAAIYIPPGAVSRQNPERIRQASRMMVGGVPML
jgi:hypothetical protein